MSLCSMQWCGSILCRYKICNGVAAYYVATPLHSAYRHILPNVLTVVTLAKSKYELPDDGRRPKYVGAF